MIRDIDIPVSLCHIIIRYLTEIVLNKVIYIRYYLNFLIRYILYIQTHLIL